ncbi:MAG: hypothetical protein OER95_01755 [Acidimicrobiia bacterium]|nr:hypothetical protein [Acidimicrobiia bacterium]
MRSVLEILIGALYLVGAGFNVAYTLRHGDEFYLGFVNGAWLGPARRFTESMVVPNSRPFTVLLILFQLGVGFSILTRGGAVIPALVVGGVFAAVVALFSSPGGTIGNLALAIAQLVLAAAR